MKQPAWRFAALALAGGVVLALLAWHSRTELLRVLRAVSPYWFAASVGAGVCLNVVYGLLFDAILCKYTGHSHRRRHVAAYMMSQPGKYLPGKLWQAAMQSIALAGQSSVTSVGVANIELSLVAVLHATGLGVACLLASRPPFALLAAVAALAIGWAFVRLPSAKLLLRVLPRLRKWLRTPHDEATSVPVRSLWLFGLTAASLAVNFAASWFLLIAAHTTLSPLQLAHLLASLWLGIAASLLALPVPAGLGIREAAVAGFGALLAPDVPAALLISVALLARCWQLLVDVASVLVGSMLWRSARLQRWK
ncbi:MAG: flippase-like domain-containing protein [Proteobacteria bacterium]|nr:flippase-like domain-containing protein [Pseudomonadota bacterium]